VDWSYRLLSPELQRFLARLSVFRGGWTAEAAEAVCEESLALDYLAQLRECSLVLTEESAAGIRFRMLETLREYAGEQLGEATDATLQKHAACCLELAETAEPHLTGPEQARWLTVLETEHGNLRAALAWRRNAQGEKQRGDPSFGLRLSGALWRFWSIRGHAREGRRIAQQLLESVTEAETTNGNRLLYAKALDGAGALAHDTGDYAQAAACLEKSRRARCGHGGARRDDRRVRTSIIGAGELLRKRALPVRARLPDRMSRQFRRLNRMARNRNSRGVKLWISQVVRTTASDKKPCASLDGDNTNNIQDDYLAHRFFPYHAVCSSIGGSRCP
jgi:hypothetical protein